MNNFQYLIYSVVLTIVGLGLWITLNDYEEILRAIQNVGWNGFAFLCGLSLFNYLLRYLRWIFLLRQFGDKFPFVGGLICYFSGFALTTTPGKAGETIRSLYFNRRYQTPVPHALAALLSERVGDALTGLLIALFAFYTFENTRWLGFCFTTAIILVVLSVQYPQMLLEVSEKMRVIKVSLVHKVIDIVPVFLQRTAHLLTIRVLGTGVMIVTVAWCAEAFGFAWLALQMGGQASVWLYMSIFAIAMVAGAITFMPGGLGGTEAVMYILLKLTGLDSSEALTIALLCRLATLWFAVVLGILSLLWLENNPESLSAK